MVKIERPRVTPKEFFTHCFRVKNLFSAVSKREKQPAV